MTFVKGQSGNNKGSIRKYDLTGQKFSRLTVDFPTHNEQGVGGYWSCTCSCGNNKVVDTYSLRNGNVKSCGCLNLDASIKPRKHGMWKSSEYAAYSAMKARCLNSDDPAYSYYGARGISVCERWLGEEGFVNFIADMGRKSSPELSLDRYPNNDGNYEPGNCRWATWSEQMSNRRKDEGKPKRSTQSLKKYWSTMSAEERKEEVKRRKLTTKKEIL